MKHLLLTTIAAVVLVGCATWEKKLDQRAKWEKFREESNQPPTLPFQKWPREK